ncbi:phosphate acetyltransferase [Collinsella sp. zg1085]|uniref:phosphate acyltransferase n=1 Tax=Collinsella sp. zg1085 TaxID=2844380 RepID=UPI001C0D2D4B|nr:phosphate acyltransferase [Collinsella sp. zg1085]QWT17162.1 phosphate acetyltransferase [Collinsella sp. zg1085]
MSLMDSMFERAKAAPQRVAFSEATDPTMMRAVGEIVKRDLAHCVLVGNTDELQRVAKDCDVDLSMVELADIADETATEELLQRFLELPSCRYKEKGVRRRLAKPLERSLIMQAVDEVDVSFAGITASTEDVIVAGQSIVGLAPGIETISSMGIFDIPGFEGSEGAYLGFGDSAVCQNPTATQLASIAISACDTLHALTGWEPRCAMLSYSTCGSGAGPLVEKVVEALEIARSARPDLKIDGEFQLDSAINPRTAARKVLRESDVAGQANLLIWPDLNVGNIAVKLVQQFAQAEAYGPMLQGFNKIVCDCSRSAGVEEIVGNVAMSCVRAAALKEE